MLGHGVLGEMRLSVGCTSVLGVAILNITCLGSEVYT